MPSYDLIADCIMAFGSGEKTSTLPEYIAGPLINVWETQVTDEHV
jgi:hypothetical protein